MPSGEIQTDAIVRSALAAGKKVFVPYLQANPRYVKAEDGGVSGGGPRRIMDMVSLHGLSDYEGLERDGWGIPTVGEAALGGRERILGGQTGGINVEGLGLILMPGVAFEKSPEGVVKRLGHGRGFYDYFLEQYREAHEKGVGEEKRMKLYGLALEEQVLGPQSAESVPVGPLDSPLDGLLVGDGSVVESDTSP